MMAQMRAVLVKNGIGGVGSLFIGQASKPKPSIGEVLVKVSPSHFVPRLGRVARCLV
jgi:hypothetical protein